MYTKERYQITIIGSAVNLASRLEGKAEGDQIIISPKVKEKVRGKFIMDDIKLKEEIKSYPTIKYIHAIKENI